MIYYIEILKEKLKLSKMRYNKTSPLDYTNEDHVFFEDEDIVEERLKVHTSIDDNPIVLKELRKEFVGKKSMFLEIFLGLILFYF